MPPTLNKEIDPQKYYRDVLSHGLRPDGRSLSELRSMSVNVKSLENAEGSAIVKIGHTAVVAGIKAELAKPKAETPDEGYLVANVELPPLCSSQYHPGPPSDHAQETGKFLDETLKNLNCIDLKDLCIIPSELVWVLHLDVVCINQDGSLIDACMTAAIAALKVTSLPHIEYNLESGVKTVDMKNQKMLQVHKFPVATTFAVFENNQILIDPTSEEESLSTGTLTIVIDSTTKMLCGIHQPGSDPLSMTELENCLTEAEKKTKSVEELVNTAIGNVLWRRHDVKVSGQLVIRRRSVL